MLSYLHWSITDNYEWGSFTAFSIFTVDYSNHASDAVDHRNRPQRPMRNHRTLEPPCSSSCSQVRPVLFPNQKGQRTPDTTREDACAPRNTHQPFC